MGYTICIKRLQRPSISVNRPLHTETSKLKIFWSNSMVHLILFLFFCFIIYNFNTFSYDFEVSKFWMIKVFFLKYTKCLILIYEKPYDKFQNFINLFLLTLRNLLLSRFWFSFQTCEKGWRFNERPTTTKDSCWNGTLSSARTVRRENERRHFWKFYKDWYLLLCIVLVGNLSKNKI